MRTGRLAIANSRFPQFLNTPKSDQIVFLTLSFFSSVVEKIVTSNNKNLCVTLLQHV